MFLLGFGFEDRVASIRSNANGERERNASGGGEGRSLRSRGIFARGRDVPFADVRARRGWRRVHCLDEFKRVRPS